MNKSETMVQATTHSAWSFFATFPCLPVSTKASSSGFPVSAVENERNAASSWCERGYHRLPLHHHVDRASEGHQ